VDARSAQDGPDIGEEYFRIAHCLGESEEGEITRIVRELTVLPSRPPVVMVGYLSEPDPDEDG
jgi:hypothetical protein